MALVSLPHDRGRSHAMDRSDRGACRSSAAPQSALERKTGDGRRLAIQSCSDLQSNIALQAKAVRISTWQHLFEVLHFVCELRGARCLVTD